MGKVREFLCGIDDQDGEVCFVCYQKGAFDALALEIGIGGTESCCVDEFEVETSEGDAFSDEVPGGAWSVADNGPVLVEEDVEKAAFAGIRSTENGKSNTLGESIVELVSLDEAVNFGDDLSKFGQGAGLVFFREVFFGEVNVGFEVGTESSQLFHQCPDFVTNSPSQVSVSDFNGFFTFGLDQFHDGLGLGKVHPAVEEGGTGELSGFGKLAAS